MNQIRNSYDVIIVGGGVIGFSIAYQSAKSGIRTLVIDRGAAGQATRAGGGMLGAQVETEEPGAFFDLALRSRSLFPVLQQELLASTGIDIELQTAGIIRVAVDEEDRKNLLSRQKWQQSQGQQAIWMEPDDVSKETGGHIQESYGALFLPDDYQVRNPQLLAAFRKAAFRYGVDLLEKTEFVSFLTSDSKITGLKTNQGDFFGDRVIVAAGAWSDQITRTLGLKIPVFPVKGQSLFLEAEQAPTPYTIFTHGTYVVPKKNGQIYVGATVENVGFDEKTTNAGISRVSASAVKLMPSLATYPLFGPIVGFRPGSVDGLPLLGPVEGYNGLFLATGHYRNGILLSAVTGVILADMMSGIPLDVSIDPFSPNRFGSN